MGGPGGILSGDALRRVLRDEAQALSQSAEKLGPEWDVFVDRILTSPGRVITCGLGKSGHIARKAAATFASTGSPSLFLHAAEAAHGDLGMVTKDDTVLAYSYSGESDELVRLLPAIRAIGAYVAVMTGRNKSSAARLADLVLDCHVDHEACPNNLAPTTSTTLMLALSDAVAVAVMERRGFGSEDFARFHPAGALGRRLTLTVANVMRTGSDLPVAKPETGIIDLMKVITQCGAGGVCVSDESGQLVGYASEGDLRRWLVSAESPLNAQARDLMNPRPTVIEPDLMAVEALEAFQNHPAKIGEMPVVQDGRVVGLLMLKDLLRSGIV